jgi:hypothetical protein
VHSNDPSQAQVALTVKAELEVLLDLEPRFVNYGAVFRGRDTTRTIELVGPDASGTKLLSAEFRPLRARRPADATPEAAVVARVAGDAEAPTVEISIAPDAPTGQFDGNVVVKTDHARLPELVVRVRGSAYGAVTFQPQRMVFRHLEDGVEQTRTLMITSNAEEPVEILEVVAEHPALTASIDETTAGRTRITVTCNGKLQRDHEATTVVVRTSSPEEPRIEVPTYLTRVRGRAVRPASSPKPVETPPTER